MRILFTLAYADGYHGSMLHIKEIASYYTSKGHECIVATIYSKKEYEELFLKENITIKQVKDIDLTLEYDILYGVHHPVVSYLLNNKVKCKKLILNSLSRVELIEQFPNYFHAASMLVVCSCRVRDYYSETLNVPKENIYVLENSIPDEFYDYKCNFEISERKPKKIAVVSNHIPDEVFSLSNNSENIEFTFFGSQTNNYKVITPEVLDGFDVIVSIGKTVIFALGMGIPVYEYDHFGGNGYITLDNFETEAYFNFAGRNTCRKLTSEEICTEIINGYSLCYSQREELREVAKNRYLLSKKLDDLLNEMMSSPDFDYNKLEKNIYIPNMELNDGTMFVNYVGDYRKQEDYVADLKEIIRNLENELHAMVNSKTWKLITKMKKILLFWKK